MISLDVILMALKAIEELLKVEPVLWYSLSMALLRGIDEDGKVFGGLSLEMSRPRHDPCNFVSNLLR